MTFVRNACLALALAAAAGCGSSKKTSAPSGNEAVSQTFTGTLSDGSLVTLDFGGAGAALLARSRPAEATGAVGVTGTLTRPDGSTVPLSGTYDPATKAFSVQGGDYSFSGTYVGGAIQAEATVNGTPVKLVAMMGSGTSVTQYCGTFTTALHETGRFNLVVSGGKAFGVAESGVSFSGTSTGATLALTDARGRPIQGTISGTKVDGTFINGDGQGTFTGSVEACTAILHPSACAYEYSAWGDCQPDKTQARTVLSTSPAVCVGAPVLAQACDYVAPTCTSFTYSDWGSCSSAATQERTVASALPDGCTGGGPVLTQACVPAPGACDYTYSEWSACTVDKTQTRTVVSATPQGCTGTPVLSQGCTYVPPACTDFTYSDWGACQPNGTQTRKVNSAGPAGCAGGAPVLVQDCTYVPPLTCAAPASTTALASQDMDKVGHDVPPPTGGVVPDGTYDLVLSVYYDQSTAQTVASSDRRRFVISGSATAIDVIAADGATVLGRFLGTLAVNDATDELTITTTCSTDPVHEPVSSTRTVGYSVFTSHPMFTGTVLQVHSVSGSGLPKLELYQKQ